LTSGSFRIVSNTLVTFVIESATRRCAGKIRFDLWRFWSPIVYNLSHVWYAYSHTVNIRLMNDGVEILPKYTCCVDWISLIYILSNSADCKARRREMQVCLLLTMKRRIAGKQVASKI